MKGTVEEHSNDISQISKYLKGELDAQAMHDLEARAMDDPFLMDALEGYSGMPAMQETVVGDLDAMLSRRIGKKEAKQVFLWRYMASAAAMLVLVCLAYLFFTKKEAVQTNEVALNQAPAAKDAPLKGVEPVIEEEKKKAVVANNKKTGKNEQLMAYESADVAAPSAPSPQAAVPVTANVTAIADTLSGQMIAANEALKKKQDATTSAAIALREVKAARETTIRAMSRLSSRAPAKASEQEGSASGYLNNVIKGTVYSADDRLPLPGVSVKIEGTQMATQTDASGHYTITVPDVKSYLLFDYLGYEHKRAKIQDSLNVALKASTNSLSEVVVSGYSSTKAEVKAAHPRNGWDSYNKYLEENAKSPDGKAGTVRLAFTVGEDGALSSFKILKSLSKQADAKAIALITDGPEWQPSLNGKPQQVKLRIKFYQ